MLMIVNLFSPGGSYDSLFLSNYALINLRDDLLRVDGVGDVVLLGGSDYGMRIWLDPDKMAKLGVTTADVAAAVREQNVEAPAGQIGQAPITAEQQFQYTVVTTGRLDTPEAFGAIVLRALPDGSILRVRGRRPGGARRQDLFQLQRLRRRADGAARRLPAPRRQRPRGGQPGEGRGRAPRAPLPRGPPVRGRVRQHPLRTRLDQRSGGDADPHAADRGGRRVRLPGRPALHTGAGAHHSGLADRDLRLPARLRVHDQHHLALRADPRHRDRGRRRHHRGREREALDGGGGAARPGRHDPGDGGGDEPDHRHHPGADGGLRAGGLHPGNYRTALPAVCRDHLDLRGDLVAQRPHAEPGPVQSPAEPPRRGRAPGRRASTAGLRERAASEPPPPTSRRSAGCSAGSPRPSRSSPR